MTSLPDLTADNLLTRDEIDRLSNILRLGRKFGLSWKEHNVGTAPLDQNQQPYQIGVYLSQDANITTSDRLLFTVNVPLPGFAPLTLSAGDSFGWQIAAPLPDNVVPGNYFLGVIEDIGNSVQEASETNNASSGVPIVIRPIVSSDFNGDGHSDILLRSTGGTVVDWTMSGPQISTAQVLTYQGNPVPPLASWNVAGIGNFNGDQNADILMRSSDGMFVDWTMNGSEIASAQTLTFQGTLITSLNSSWAVVGVGDFNGDHNADILLRSAGGTFVDWTMNGSEIASAQILAYQGTQITSLDASWSVVGVGDFNGDHNADILLRSAGGTFVDWTMNGSDIASAQILTFQGSPSHRSILLGSWMVSATSTAMGSRTSCCTVLTGAGSTGP